jgi:phosphoglycerate kinase
MNLKKIQKADLQGKNVLVRVSFNVPFEGKEIKEDYKIKSVKETIDYIIKKGGKVTMMSNLGRPLEFHKNNPGVEWMSKFSFRSIVSEIGEILETKIKLIPSCDENVIKKHHQEFADKCDVFLLENIKFYKEEKENDDDFAQRLASNFDVFINESFSDSHRGFVSTNGIAKKLPSYAGFQTQKEVKNLERVKDHPEHPAVAIIGGAKIDTKLPLIKSFTDNYDFILVGGKIANEAIDRDLDLPKNVILPIDFRDKGRFDIGDKTIDKFSDIISHASTIVWNGPMGLFEKEPFYTGTREILDAIIDSGAFVVAGGGESVEAINQSKAMDKLTFVSTGGGAMLSFLSGERMPGLEVLEDK